ncbi:MAG: hypothetical protein H6905_01080 [Hyphomicrobiales bacterium]|nr:hypothetical protein [Hyphomicrobiales bacterium]
MTHQDDSAVASPPPSVTEDSVTHREHEAMLIARTVGRVAPHQAENEPVPLPANTAATLAEVHSPGPEANSVLPFLPPETTLSNAAAPEKSSHILHSETAEDQLRVAPALSGLQASTSPLSPEPEEIIPARLAPDFSSGPVSSNKPPATLRSVDSRIGLGFIEPETFNDPLSRLNAGAGGLLLLELEQRASSTPSRSGDTYVDDTVKPALKDSETLTLNPPADKQIDLIRDQEPAKDQSTRPDSDAIPPSAALPNASVPLSRSTINTTAEVKASPAIQDLELSDEKLPALPGEVPYEMTGEAPANRTATHPSSGHTAPPLENSSERAATRDEEIYGPVASDQPGGPET